MVTEQQIKVVIADDQDIYRDGLQMLLSKDKGIKVIAEASNGRRLADLVKQFRPDVVLTDLVMPEMDGIHAISEITSSVPTTRCIAITTYDTDQLIIEALEAGAMGYIVKNAQKGEIIEAIKTVYEGHPYYCKTTSIRLAKKISKSRFNPYTIDSHRLFSDKEKEIIRPVCEEKTSDEIGRTLFMSGRTVERIRSKILEKMNVKTSAGVAIYAIKNGIYIV